jgi:REP element-mobilizing transposase RayT
MFVAICRALAKTWREWFRVVHFSVQADHIHLIVEADDKDALTRGLQGLSIRLARAINRVARRKGTVFSERYHMRGFTSPRGVRNVLVYVLLNRRKHYAKTAWATGNEAPRGVDPMSSGYWFDGWRTPPKTEAPPHWQPDDLVPVQPARSWLASKGWRRHGLIGIVERPKLDADQEAWLSLLE